MGVGTCVCVTRVCVGECARTGEGIDTCVHLYVCGDSRMSSDLLKP